MKQISQFALLRERRFAPFFGVQFLGALNDNVFKQALIILLAFQTASFTTMSTDVLQNVAQALFVLPFFIFSATAGQLADKYEKSRLISITVLIELAVMVLGAIGFFMRSLEILFLALFLGGVQSALFGPVKYAILPQHLRESEIIGGNGLVEMGTSIAILLGMMLGGWLASQAGWGIAAVAIARSLFRSRPAAVAVHPNRACRRPRDQDQLESRYGNLAQLPVLCAATGPFFCRCWASRGSGSSARCSSPSSRT